MFNKVLIANRGEIACRIIKTCHRLNISTVAVYSTADKDALHVKLAGEAVCIGDAPAKDSYLCTEKIISAAKKTHACAVHPGYGFLAENTHLALRLQEENIVFIGPNVEALEIMGSKSNAKSRMENAGVPTTPGYHGKDQSEKTLLKEAEGIGFPVLLKAASGGGGKGMRVVSTKTDFITALHAAKREALKSFNDDTMLIETYLPSPRHIEVQVFADKKGNVVHLFERDCSIQRRHQKIIEEAPATNIDERLKQKMYQAAIDATRAVNYEGAGTIEFLLDGDTFYFMEMNTRLQVEHPVTEMITNIDLVEWQLRVAMGQALPLCQDKIKASGHAIEVRLYAEDTNHDFLPQTGRVRHCHWPKESSHIRIDTGIEENSEISIFYDPMIAKIITYGVSRDNAIQRMQHALTHTYLTGITHNRAFLSHILSLDTFKDAKITTHFLEDNAFTLDPPTLIGSIAASLYPFVLKSTSCNPWENNHCWRMNLPAKHCDVFYVHGKPLSLTVYPLKNNFFSVETNKQTIEVKATHQANTMTLSMNGGKHALRIIREHLFTDVITDNTQIHLEHANYRVNIKDTDKGQLTAPMPGNIIAILCKKKETVDKGQTLMIIEAMKMEHTINAPDNAIIKDIFFKVGAQVNEGDELLALEPPS